MWLDRKCDEKSLKICTTKRSNKKNPQNVFFMNKQHREKKIDMEKTNQVLMYFGVRKFVMNAKICLILELTGILYVIDSCS